MTKRDARALYYALEEQAAEDSLDEIAAMSDEQLDRLIDENGGDSRAIRASGAALANELSERRERLGWHADMERKIDVFRASASAQPRRAKLPRAELLRRIAAARGDARFAAPVAALFQKKTSEASTDDELAALLEQIELLAKIDEV